MRNIRAIHQFTPTVASGDSVSNALLFVQRMLKSLGVASEIYICDKFVDRTFCHPVEQIASYTPSEGDLLFYHHSIGHRCHAQIMQLPIPKIMVYHNITPSHFFSGAPHIQEACDLGRRQLAEAATAVIAAIADSAYNAKELKALHYDSPVVLPLLLDPFEAKTEAYTEEIPLRYEATFNLLFVGRVVQNKAQHLLIDVVEALSRKGYEDITLFIVGGVSQPDYFEFLQQYAIELGLAPRIIITNKVSDEALAGYYRAADCYLSLSEHEGFGIPLIEAMRYDIPVLAYDSGAIASTVIPGALLQGKSPLLVAERVIALKTDAARRRVHRMAQRRHLERFRYANLKKELIGFLEGLSVTLPRRGEGNGTVVSGHSPMRCRIEGPFDSSYSLAIVNRNTAEAMEGEAACEVSLYSTEGYGDFEPETEALSPAVQRLARREMERVDVTLRNLYPPRTAAMQGTIRAIGPYGWEESRFPEPWIDRFNDRLDLLFAMSSYVQRHLRVNGISLPIITTGIVVEEILSVPAEPLPWPLPEGFRLLHISSAFPRKGVAKLFEACRMLSASSKPFVLVLKTFPNPHNRVASLLETYGFQLSRTAEPGVAYYKLEKMQLLWIDRELSLPQMRALYESCNLLVAPSYGEGFGLPMAEAMLCSLPVATTAYGGQRDFCTPQTAWLFDFDFALAETHMELSDSLWAEPVAGSIAEIITRAAAASVQEKRQRCESARRQILQTYASEAVAARICKALLQPAHLPKPCRPALFSSWNTACGIAEYSRYLVSTFEEEVQILASRTVAPLHRKEKRNVHRCWDEGRETEDIGELKATIEALEPTHLILQYNFSFLPLPLLEALLQFCMQKKIVLYLFLHATDDVVTETYTDSLRSIAATLNQVDRIYVHRVEDMNRLKKFGIYERTCLFRHGIDDTLYKRASLTGNDMPMLATFGFLLPQKGIFEMVDLAQRLHARQMPVRLLLLTAIHPAPVSRQLLGTLREHIAASGLLEYITLCTDFLPEEEVVERLRGADKILFLYNRTQESSSAAVRFGLLSGSEVITTPLPIFNDVREVVRQTSGVNMEAIEASVLEALQTPFHPEKTEAWIANHSWKRISRSFRNSFAESEVS